MTYVSWDNAAVALAVLAVLLRWLDCPRTATLASSLAVLLTTIGGWRARHRPRAAASVAGCREPSP
jgi:hypothetical protein